ncbi:DnaJ like subfamily C member 9 [Lipomyces oligophaga]|uniref:DnaJ like subfamily C member 9 n=1 Tax=Lipomyces oligophaga TaxID=45792 RepID=UPI0034CF7D58
MMKTKKAKRSAEDNEAEPPRSIEDESAEQFEPKEEELELESLDPYAVLGIAKTASSADVRRAYRRLALIYHPDKATFNQTASQALNSSLGVPESSEDAHVKFQQLVFVYGILSDEEKRRVYDSTGSLIDSEGSAGVDGYEWREFYKDIYNRSVSTEMIEQDKRAYQGSEEEMQDVLQSYKDFKGDMNLLFETIIHSDQDLDQDRFRTIIDDAIQAGTAKTYKAYKVYKKLGLQKPSEKAVLREAQEAEELARELGIDKALEGTKSDEPDGGLGALIRQRQLDRMGRMNSFLDNLESKYATSKQSKKKRKTK